MHLRASALHSQSQRFHPDLLMVDADQKYLSVQLDSNQESHISGFKRKRGEV